MKNIIKLFALSLAVICFYSCTDEDKFATDPESGWVQFRTASTTIAVNSRTTAVNIPVDFTAPINRESLEVSFEITNVDNMASDVLTNIQNSVIINADTNTSSISFGVKSDAVDTLIAIGDVVFDIEITAASRGVAVGIADGSSTTTHTVSLLCGGEPDPGTYTIDMHDSYGDGWQTDDANAGSGITVVLTKLDDSQEVIEFGMCSPYAGGDGTFLRSSECTGPASTMFFDATTTITLASDVVDAVWNFPGDNYDEISFEIYYLLLQRELLQENYQSHIVNNNKYY